MSRNHIVFSVIVPVWNRADLTANFLFYNWRLYHSRTTVEFVVIDNGSTDNTDQVLLSWKRQMRSRLKIHRFSENTGFGPANNYGAEIASGEILVFLSNDVSPLGDYLTPVLETLDGYPQALVGAEYMNFDTGWNKFDGEIIPYLGGWCLACSRQTWDKLGGFDEQFVPCDYEDLDLCRTAIEKKIKLFPATLPLKHQFGQSAKRLTGGRLQTTLKNKKLFMEKWNYVNAE